MSNDGKEPSDFDNSQWSEQTAILYRLDERTERIDSRMERIAGRVKEQDKRIAEHDDRIQRNTTIINAITFGVGSFVTAVMAKFGGFFRL
ncbi:hypothetical protein [Halapricum desulfuricans]|uniref:Uncharacterized protein n=1 Tax=Halapricum desulfuricans TaxID=2841257 RepID=A0A897N127_9EURY|nr:hypothetical protein [Halapricum desulfuricans]QSG06394.1 hypothetical protein HSR121_2062 [Halapricum desulfuricans]